MAAMLAQSLKKVGVAIAGLAIGREILQFGKSAITAAADFEALEIAFTTFLGSSKEAEKVLKDLEDLSVSTPFTPEQVQNAGKALLAFGVEWLGAFEIIFVLRHQRDAFRPGGSCGNPGAKLFDY